MDILVILLNYQREANVARILDALDKQSVAPRVALWNNGAAADFPRADFQIQSPENLKCLPRWHLASLLGRDYVAILDDDLLPRRVDLLERCVEKSREYRDDCIVGRSGKLLGRGPRHYKNGAAVGVRDGRDAPGDVFADIIKGRFMFLHVGLLQRVPLYCPYYDGRGDDIWVSLKTSTRRKQHVIPEFVRDAFEKIPVAGTGLMREDGHNERRDRIVADLLANGEIAWSNAKPRADLRARLRSLLGSGETR